LASVVAEAAMSVAAASFQRIGYPTVKLTICSQAFDVMTVSFPMAARYRGQNLNSWLTHCASVLTR
jgi:hypothetical protein